MKKILLLVAMIIGLNAYQINIKSGWQLKGALEDINVTSVFNKPEIISVWTYDDENNKWRAYLPNTNIDLNKFGIKPLNTINKGEGFWVNSIENININPVNYKNKLITEENKLLTINFSNVSEINNDCIINFGDGNSQEFIDKCPNSVTHIYKKPGVYNLYLISNNEKIEHKVVIVNNEDPNHWVGYVSSLNNYLEENEKVEDFYVDGKLYIAPSLSDKWYYWTNFRYVNNNSNINSVDGNDFTIVARIKNPSSEGGISCYDPGISVMGENGKRAVVTFMSEGCTYYAAIGAADWFQSGGSWNCNSENSTCEYADLSALGRDFSDWKVVKMQVKDKKVSVYYENEEIYTMTYKGSIGKLVGISISFKGSGSIDWVKIYNNEGVLVYSEDF